MATARPFGTWASPLAASDLVEGALGLGYPVLAGSAVLWQEARPSEGGRIALMAWDGSGSEPSELLPRDMSSRTTVHEYGGRAWAAGGPGGETVVASNFEDQRLWDVSPGRPPRPLTPAPDDRHAVRFACPAISPDGAWVVAVRERHQADGVVNDLVAVPTGGPGVVTLAEGHDFYSDPVFSPDGQELAFICWDHPDMPWDRTQLWRGRFAAGRLTGIQAVAGQEGAESVLQPRWLDGGAIAYVSDRTGWWNLYRRGPGPQGPELALAPMSAEFAGPAWVFGDSNYAPLADGALMAAWDTGGTGYLGLVENGVARPLEMPYNDFWHLAPAGPHLLAVAGGPARPPEIIRTGPGGDVSVLRRSRPTTLEEDWVSKAEAFSFATTGGQEAHGFFYAPRNPLAGAPADELPPLIVTSHGGPTSRTSTWLDLSVQYWTTRGFAVAAVDYRGSTGYGRSYRQALDGQWGVADVEDCVAAARWLAGRGWAGAARMMIRGGSSSGLTAMAAAARHPFAAVVVRFGVAEVASLAATTHKFESRYIERLVPAGEMAARSPLNMVGAIHSPVLFFHGLDDKVVPPSQSRQMVQALRDNGVKALLIEIEGEGHGFRRASTVVRAQEAELAFYGEVLGFEPAGDLSRARADLALAARPEGTTWPVQ